MKGRPVTTEEFERMLTKTADVVGETAAPSWRHFLCGLWLSGLRLGEALELWWDRDDRLLPMAPDFAEYLMKDSESERSGPVFHPKPKRDRGRRLTLRHVSKRICEIGERARVKVATDPKTAKVKYASAHDLRRSFGERWSARVMPHILMELMRHEDITTTNKYYVGRNAERTADVLWEAYKPAAESNTFGNTPSFGTVRAESVEGASGNDSSGCDKLPPQDSNLD